AFYTLNICIKNLVKLLAPICPYIADKIYSDIGYGESCHLSEWPEVNKNKIDEELEKNFKIIQKINETSNSIRQEEGIGLRYPIKKMTISGPDEIKRAVESLENILKKMTNVKEINSGKISLKYRIKLNYSKIGPKYGKDVKKIENLLEEEDKDKIVEKLNKNGSVDISGYTLKKEDLVIETSSQEGKEFSVDKITGVVVLDTEETPEIFEESLVRELIRNVQQMRKDKKLVVEQKIKLNIDTDDETKQIIEKWSGEIKKEVGAKEFSFCKVEDGKISKYKNKSIKFNIEMMK
ncbi:MAG: class I tRNA ligase family protein, partial [Candidatus Aenigmarchaeota archaeon]|nr:class I tRNA ligase family protein [Candidatus Aenigmarchaeota archaeon]